MADQVPCVFISPSCNCVDLRATFGRQYRIELEESYWAEKPEYRADQAAWLMIIPCRFGHIYPFGGSTLAAWTYSPSRRRRLAGLACCRIHQEGDREITALFDVADFARVAAALRPRRRRRLSAEQRAASVERLVAFRFRSKSAARRNESKAQARGETGHDDSNPTFDQQKTPKRQHFGGSARRGQPLSSE